MAKRYEAYAISQSIENAKEAMDDLNEKGVVDLAKDVEEYSKNIEEWGNLDKSVRGLIKDAESPLWLDAAIPELEKLIAEYSLEEELELPQFTLVILGIFIVLVAFILSWLSLPSLLMFLI